MLGLGHVDRASDTPVSRQIAEQLRLAISQGSLGPGDQLPSEAQLMEHYGVARMTVRHALADLRTEGLIVAEHGRGVYVRAKPRVRRLASDRFARQHREAGRAAFLAESADVGTPSVDQIAVSEETPPHRVRQLLELPSRARVVVRRRRYLIDGHPVETAVSYLPATIARGTAIADTDTGPGGIYARLEELGHELGSFIEEVAARMPTPEERRRLLLPAGEPVLTVLRVAIDTSGRPVEVCDTVKAAASYALEYRFPAQ